jgi:hypothetical protein
LLYVLRPLLHTTKMTHTLQPSLSSNNFVKLENTLPTLVAVAQSASFQEETVKT